MLRMDIRMMRRIVMILVIALIHVSNGEFQRFQQPTKPDGSLHVLVLGDWGRKGHYNQSQLAHQMGVTTDKNKMDIDFVISTGDNFYDDGLIDVNDPAFHQSFTDIYTAPSLQKTWYNVLGNHDYRGDALAQLSPILQARDNRWFCMKSFILDADIVEFFFIDTTPFQDKYFTKPKDHVYDWRGVLPREKYLSTLMQDLESALIQSKAKWKIVIGHHTIKSASDHGNTQELVDKVLPILEANGVDLYINGHDHCLQHIASPDSPLQFLTSGGGSKAWRGVYEWPNPKEMKFFYDGQGFMTLDITHHQISLNFYDIFGNILHKWSVTPQPSIISAI
ncbi:purple acid phosphatase 4-like [Salvia splendens]|uniref:purple acid phosphatase 4-like n=1 Tax=Salvia splendens TaxID=180675 RepID=UPI001C26F44F|nr:purple acid phosphatase 4-like [Salvia splendens]